MKYLLIGDGRVSKHLQYYFNLLKLEYFVWSRKMDPEFQQLASMTKDADLLICLLKDSVIEDFCAKHLIQFGKPIIHCSGALSTIYAWSAHPLLSFADKLYELDFYQEIPFIIEKQHPAYPENMDGVAVFKHYFTNLKNPVFAIEAVQKPYYHALCVSSNNFTTILWQNFFNKMSAKFSIPKSVLFPFLESTIANLLYDSSNALTGPIARDDQITIKKNIDALVNDDLQAIYLEFLQWYKNNHANH